MTIRAAIEAEAALPVPAPSRDPKVDWVAIEHLVDDAIRREAITTSRGAEILGLQLRTWRDRALEIRDEGNPLALPVPALDALQEALQEIVDAEYKPGWSDTDTMEWMQDKARASLAILRVTEGETTP